MAKAGLALERITTTPPLGAGAFKASVPVAALPPGTLPTNDTPPSSANKLMSAFAVTPLKVAEILTKVEVATALLVTVKLALVWPAATEIGRASCRERV